MVSHTHIVLTILDTSATTLLDSEAAGGTDHIDRKECPKQGQPQAGIEIMVYDRCL